MKKDWEIKKLVEVCEILTCGVASTPKYVDENEGIPFLSAQNVRNGKVVLDKYKFISVEFHKKLTTKNKPTKGDVLYSRVGAKYGEAGVVEHDFEFSVYVSLTLIRPKKNYLESYFLKNYLNSTVIKDLAKKSISSSGVPNLNVKDVREFPILIPPLPEQKRRVSILDRAFAEIDTAKANAEQNLKNAKELFESVLNGEFSMVNGKLKDGWVEKSFEDVCVLQRGFDLPTRLRKEGIYPLVSSNGITDYIDVWKIKSPGVATGRSGTIGKVHFIEKDYWPLNTSLFIKEFHGNYERCIYYFLKQIDLSKYASGAGVPTLNRNNVHGEKVWFPKSIEEQKQIVQKLDTLSAETKNLENIYQQKLEDLEEFKKSILQKAFNGEL